MTEAMEQLEQIGEEAEREQELEAAETAESPDASGDGVSNTSDVESPEEQEEEARIVGVRLERARLRTANLKADLKEGTTTLDFSIQYDREQHAGLAILHERLMQLGNRDVICYVAPYQTKLNEQTEQPPATREEEQQQLGFSDNDQRVGEIPNMPGVTWGDPVRLDKLDEFCRLSGYQVISPEQVGEGPDTYIIQRGEGLECLQIARPLADIITDPPLTWAVLLEQIEAWFCEIVDQAQDFDDGDLIPDCGVSLRWNQSPVLAHLGAFLRSQGYHIYEDGPGRPETWLLGTPDGVDVQLDVSVLEQEGMTWRRLLEHVETLQPEAK